MNRQRMRLDLYQLQNEWKAASQSPDTVDTRGFCSGGLRAIHYVLRMAGRLGNFDRLVIRINRLEIVYSAKRQTSDGITAEYWAGAARMCANALNVIYRHR